MEPDVMWSALLSIIVTAIGFWVKSWTGEITRLQILINKTREEYITKSDSFAQMDRVMNRLDGLDASTMPPDPEAFRCICTSVDGTNCDEPQYCVPNLCNFHLNMCISNVPSARAYEDGKLVKLEPDSSMPVGRLYDMVRIRD